MCHFIVQHNLSLSASKLNRFGHHNDRIRNASDKRRNFDPEDRNSLTNFKTCMKCNKIKRSRSQEMTTKVLDIRLNDEVLEWFQLNDNTVKVKMWGEKLRRIADKLQYTHEQEKLKNKIERYLKRVPSQFSECDDDRREFRKQLPEQLIRRLRRFYNKNKQRDALNVYHVEMPNYYSKIQTNQDELRNVVRSWLKTICFKRRDFLGRPVRRDDVIDFIEYKLQPFITDKSNSEQEYKYVLKSKIIETLNELPVATSGECLNRQADKLIEDILNVTNIAFENKDNKNNFKSNHIRPAIKEIKDFITDQIIQYSEQNNIVLRASKIFRLEMDLTDILSDVFDTSAFHDSVNVKRRVLEVMRRIGKLTTIRAVDFTDTLINNFRKTYQTVNDNLPNYLPHECYSVYVQNRSSKRKYSGDLSIGDVRHSVHSLKGVNYYNKQLIHQINDWLKDIQVPKQKKASKDTAVKQLAADIVDRHKYLELNPDSKGTEAEELEHLKFQIFKWIHLVGEENKTTLERAPDLMKRIQSVPVPLLSSQHRSENYVSHLTDVIFEWYRDLPIDLHSSDDDTMRNQNVKNLAENIEKAMKTKKSVNEIVNKEVHIWTKKVFSIQPESSTIDQLKVKLKAVINKDENNLDKDPKQEKVHIRRYEDIIDDWLDTFPLEPKREASFVSTRNEYIHDLAVKLHNSRIKLESAAPDVLNKKLQDEVSDWLKKIPLHQQTNKKAFRDQFAGRLIRNILESNQEESLEMREKLNSSQFTDIQIEGVLIDWLKTLPLYREKSVTEKQKQDKVMSELAKKLNSALQGHSNCNPDLEIEKHIKMLDIVFRNDREYVQKTALQLKLHLQNLNMFTDTSQTQDPNDEEFLNANIEEWMRNLPLNVPSDVERKELENKKKAFAKTMKELRANKANDDVLIGEIVNFMKTLPLNRKDVFFLKAEASKLLKSLYVPLGDVTRNKPPTTELVRDAISNWSVLLPLKPIYCPTELRSLIDQMTRDITDQVVTSDSVGESNEEKIKQIILDYLRKFPIKPERRDEQQLDKMALALLNDIREVQLFRSDCSGEVNKPLDNQLSKNSNDLSKPKLSTQGDTEKQNFESIPDEYTTRLTTEIEEWLSALQGQIPEIHDKSFRKIVVNDLAGDIVDRHKYLELNPTIRGSDEDELEHLKYQIFKWINKLVGEDNLVTIEHASELMERIRGISTPVSATTIMRENPVMASTPAIEPPSNNKVFEHAIEAKKLPPMNPPDAGTDRHNVEAQINGPATAHADSMTSKIFSKNESRESTCQTVSNRGPSIHTETASQTLACVSEGKDAILTPQDIQVRPTGTSIATYDAGTMIYSQETLTDRVNPSTQKNASQVFRPSYLDLEASVDETPREIKSTPNTNQASIPLQIVSPRKSPPEIVSQKSQPYEVGSTRNYSHFENFPTGMTVVEVHKQYDGIIRELCAQLPFKSNTPDEERMADLARKAVYNTIWKTYFKFKSDPELENDYVYMEFLLEGTLDDCLDIVTNSEIENMSQAWKGKMILHVMDMIKCVHSISDTPSFREQLGSKMDRLFTKDRFGEVEYQVSQMFISRIADSYILYANYKNEDPIKANIYRHRLMKRLEMFVQEQTKQHNKEFRKLDDAKMCQKALKILESVPLPTDDVLKEEADEVLLNEEIENWYKDLPVQPIESQYDEQFRRRMLEVLAKKIRDMEERPGIDESSMQSEMKHEMSVFLKKRAKLQQDQDLNINFMVDELTNRLKNRKNRRIDYESFQKDVPLSSTFEEMESADALAPLVDSRPISQTGHLCSSGCRRSSRRGILGTSQIAGHSNQYMSEQPMMQPRNQYSSFSMPTVEYKPFDEMTQSAGLSNMNQLPTQQHVPNPGYTSTHYPYTQSHPCMQQQNQTPPEYIFSPNQMPQMAPYPGQEPHLNISEYSSRLTPDNIASNFQQPVQYTRSSLPGQIPSYGYLGAEIPDVKATPLSARVSDVIMSRDIPDVNMQMEEVEMRDNEREESRCRCVEYCRRRRTRICIPYNDRRRCYPGYPMPMPFPFNCFY